ncbi:MAG TPA: hypothetical protein VFY20_09795 [Gemmatimonadales bacterium]|nr:hypothetical protein [Gemmatimonadales bacterium]
MKPRTLVLLALACASAAIQVSALARGVQDDAPPSFTASKLLDPAVLRGPHHRVEEAVRTEQYLHAFTVTSDYGTFEALGRSQLATRVSEVQAIAALEDVSKTEVFLEASGRAVVNVGKGAVSAVKDPAATAKGIGSGIKRFGVNLGRRTQRATESATGSDQPGPSSGENAAASTGNALLGVTSAMRRWARKVGADPYTTNRVLRESLQSIAKVDAAGSIATKVVVPIPGVVSITSGVGDLVWGRDPEEVRKVNEQRLRELGVADKDAKRFASNGWFTLTWQTRLVAALHAARVPGSADYVHTAAEAKAEREALFFVESAELLADQHRRAPYKAVLQDSRALVAVAASGQADALLPIDWVPWTAESRAALDQMATRARRELKATRLRLVLTGRTSPAAAAALPGLGWTVVELPAAKPGSGA